MTHNEFEKEVRKEWNLSPDEPLTKNCWNIYYQYTMVVKGERKVIGNFDGRFHIYKKDSPKEEIYNLT